MKKIALLILSIVFVLNSSNAQDNCEKGPSGSLRLNLELNAMTSLRNKGMTTHGYNFDLGISIYKNLYALGSVELMNYHDRNGEHKTYYNCSDLSGGLVYNIIDKTNTTIPFKVKIGTTLGNPEWKYTLYDASLALNQRIGKSNTAIVLGLGYRHNKSRTEDILSHSFLYAFLGLKL
ncbi:MAG: hypothetical protein IJV17_05390 [Prevotella sp.]|nr:hypothetical protein [Prevotella sp.]